MAELQLSPTRVLVAAFVAGIASLLMEMSLLREVVFVLGSTATSNSFVVSLFLAGIALGAFLGSRVAGRGWMKAETLLPFLQAVFALTILAFVFSKRPFFFRSTSVTAVYLYFGAFALVPSVVSGASFSLFVRLLFHRGERHVGYLYATSTLGSVLGGLGHGFLLVPYVGMRGVYVAAIASAVLAALLIAVGTRRKLLAAALLLLTPLVPARTWQSPNGEPILQEWEDPNGVVQITAITPGTPFAKNIEDYYHATGGDERAVFISGLYNCSSTSFDREWKHRSVTIPMRLLGRPTRALLLGYCSGESAATILRTDPKARVHVVELNRAVLQMAQTVFADNYRLISSDPRAQVTLGEFRRTLRFADPGDRYDFVVVDVSLFDPAYHGVFTREFLELIRDHLTPDGILFSHYPLFTPSIRQVFPYAYRPRTTAYLQRFYAMRDLGAVELAATDLIAADVGRKGRLYEDAGPTAPP